MRTYTKQEIDNCRNSFREKRYSEVSATFGNRNFSYFELPRELNPHLPNFVFRCTGKPKDGYVLGISEDVRPDFRKYAVAHEFIEFIEPGADMPGRCVKALEEELKLVPYAIRREYLEMRRDFFINLVIYSLNHPEGFTESDINEFRQSLGKLEKLAK